MEMERKIEQVENYRHLVRMLTENWRSEVDIKTRNAKKERLKKTSLRRGA